VKVFTSSTSYLFSPTLAPDYKLLGLGGRGRVQPVHSGMRYAVLGMLLLFALGDGCSPPPNVVGVQDYGRVAGRVLDAMTNRPVSNAVVSVGSLYTARADVNGGFILRTVAGDQTVTARAAGYSTATADTTIAKDATVSIGYIRLVPLTSPQGQPTLAPPATPTPFASATPRTAASTMPLVSASPLPTASATP
jgi:hypothetical protein